MSIYFDPIPLQVVDGDTAKAADLNKYGTSLDASFDAVKDDIDTVNAEAADWAVVSKDWAEKAEDVEVEVGKYSSLHHSAKSLGHANNSATSASNSATSANASEVSNQASDAARAASVIAQTASETARDASVVAQTASETAQGLSETARDASVVAQTASETAQGLSETARDASVVAQTASETAQGLSETARDSSLSHSNTSQLKAWEAQAEKMSANSYAVEPAGIVVKEYTSVGDGTFTYISTTDYSAKHYANDYSFATGTRLSFHQASAPVGWTQDTSVNDAMLRVVSTGGGGTGGSDSAILMDKVPVHNHTSVATGAHTHTTRLYADSYIGTGFPLSAYNDKGLNITTPTSSNGNHSHTINNNTGSNWTPKYVDMIICERV